jgi:hypothetical protein
MMRAMGRSLEQMYDALMADGSIWWSTPDATCGLVVRDAVVVDCPPYARKWAAGVDARQLWRQAVQRGMRPITDPAEVKPKSRDSYIAWLPDVAEERVDVHDLNRIYGATMVRRWQSGAAGTHRERFVGYGWLPDGRWWVEQVAQANIKPWLYAGVDQRKARAAAEAKCAKLMADGEWRPTIATYEPGAYPVRAAVVPEWPPGFEPG